MTLPESETPPLFLMQACVQCYQNFFSKFVNKKILPGSDTTKSCMKKIQVPRSLFGGTGSEEEKQKHSKISSYLDCLEGVEERSGFESCMIRTNSDLTSDSASATYLRKFQPIFFFFFLNTLKYILKLLYISDHGSGSGRVCIKELFYPVSMKELFIYNYYSYCIFFFFQVMFP